MSIDVSGAPGLPMVQANQLIADEQGRVSLAPRAKERLGKRAVDRKRASAVTPQSGTLKQATAAAAPGTFAAVGGNDGKDASASIAPSLEALKKAQANLRRHQVVTTLPNGAVTVEQNGQKRVVGTVANSPAATSDLATAKKQELSEWQKRLARKQVVVEKEQPPFLVKGTKDADGVPYEWWVDQPSATSMEIAQSLVYALGTAEPAKYGSGKGLQTLINAALVFICTVRSKFDLTPLFETYDEALSFTDGRDLPLDGKLVMDEILARYGDFLPIIFPFLERRDETETEAPATPNGTESEGSGKASETEQSAPVP